MEGGEATEGLGLEKKGGGYARALATMAARWRPGSARAEAGGMARAGEGQRRGARAAAGLRATRGSC
jgi:hypothetical protein